MSSKVNAGPVAITIEAFQSYGYGIRRPFRGVVKFNGEYVGETGFVKSRERALELGRILATKLKKQYDEEQAPAGKEAVIEPASKPAAAHPSIDDVVNALRNVLSVIDANAHHDAVRLGVQQNGFVAAARDVLVRAERGDLCGKCDCEDPSAITGMMSDCGCSCHGLPTGGAK